MKCFFGLHKWGKWDEPKFFQFVYARGLFSNDFFSNYLTYRTCERCGRFQEREVSERQMQAQRDYEYTKMMLKKSHEFSKQGKWDKANLYLKLAKMPYKSA